jgi:1-phosphofructokinase/tagatose 6-phosphate kinase
MSTFRGTSQRRLLFVAANPSIDRLYEVDRLAIGEIHRPRLALAVPGGKGLNAARAAATLGGSVTAVAIIAGRAGDWIAEQLVELGIQSAIARAGGETRTCVSILDRAMGSMTEIYEPGAEIEPTAWDALETIVRTELNRGDVFAIALSGSLPPGAPQDGYARIARIASAASAPVVVLADTYGPALTTVLAERPAVVKLNALEAAEASGVPVEDVPSAFDATRVLRKAGAGCVVVTLGGGGAVVETGDERAHLIPPDRPGSYPVGSGDAFLGGLAVGLQRGETAIEAARLGLAAGIANAQIPGAGRLDPATAAEILPQIVIVPT